MILCVLGLWPITWRLNKYLNTVCGICIPGTILICLFLNICLKRFIIIHVTGRNVNNNKIIAVIAYLLQ